MSALPDPLPPGERAEDEVSLSLAQLEQTLREAGPKFVLRAKVKGIVATRAPRGVFVDVTFDTRASHVVIPRRVRFTIRRAVAQSLRLQLGSALDA